MKIEPLNGLETEVYQILIVEGSELDFNRLDELFEKTSICLASSPSEVLPRVFKPTQAKSIDAANAILKTSRLH